MIHDLALVGGKAWVSGKITNSNIFIDDGKISKISRATERAEKTIDCRGLLVLPGAIDSHVHFREPGLTHKEDWRTGSMAALAGGVTTVIDMPNTVPPTTTVRALEEKRKIAKRKSLVNFALFFGAANGCAGEFAKARGIAGLKLFMGQSTGNLVVENDAEVLEFFRIARAKGLPVVVHAEDGGIVQAFMKKLHRRKDPLAHCDARPPAAAVKALEKAIAHAALAGNRLHIAHGGSSVEELEEIADAKRAGVRVTLEATPHHLLLDRGDVRRLGNYSKVNPPLRSEKDRRALFTALRAGLVDTVGSDHAPHTREEKESDVWKAPPGMPGVETTLPLLLNEVNGGRLTLKRLVEVLMEKPAELFAFAKKGRIAKGFDADFAVIDMRERWTVRNGDMHSKCGWTPYHGRRLKGRVRKSVVGGRLVFDEGEFAV